MRFLPIISLILSIAALPMIPTANGGWPHHFGRCTGHGWSDGYHARNHCPPRQHSFSPHYPSQAPWWSEPAAEFAPHPEPLPHPTAATPHRSGQSLQPRGQSLFRQSGGGSSVLVGGHLAGGL